MFELALRSFDRLKSRARRVNPDKWSFDSQTGEYHRVTFTFGAGTLISTETYQERSTKRLVLIQHTGRRAMSFAGCAAALVASFVFLNGDTQTGPDGSDPGIVFLAACALFMSGAAIIPFGLNLIKSMCQLFSPAYALGPKPVPPPGLDEVERQNVHGVGGFASRDEIDRAARGHTGTFADEAIFFD